MNVGLKLPKITKAAGGLFDKEQMIMSQIDMTEAFNETQVRKQNMDGEDEGFEQEQLA